MARIEVLTGVERRRRWSDAEKRSIVAESFAAGAPVAQVAARHDLHPNQLWRWRRLSRLGELGGGGLPAFVPVAVVDEASSPPEGGSPPPTVCSPSGVIEIDLGDGCKVRVDRTVDATALRRVLAALNVR